MKFGEKLKTFEPYEPFPYSGQIRLDANESCFDLPAEIKKEIAEAMLAVDYNRYPDPYAQKLCSVFGELYGIGAENVIAGNGSDELIGVIIGNILSCSDKVLVTAPDFSMYQLYCGIAERECLVYGKDEAFSFDCKNIAGYINDNDVTFFIFSNPCNPTGAKIEPDKIEY